MRDYDMDCERIRDMDRKACIAMATFHPDLDIRAAEERAKWEVAARMGREKRRREKLGMTEGGSPILIFREVAKATGVPVQEIKGPGRTKPIIEAKRLAIGRLSEECKWLTTSQIGNLMGGMDHTTVVHHRKKYYALKSALMDANAPAEVPFQ